MSPEARHVFVSGRVQGVGFRWFVRERAREFGLVGWVRNLRDGRVEAWLEGPPEALATVLERLRAGPTSAQVEQLEVTDSAALAHEKFEVQRGLGG